MIYIYICMYIYIYHFFLFGFTRRYNLLMVIYSIQFNSMNQFMSMSLDHRTGVTHWCSLHIHRAAATERADATISPRRSDVLN